LYADFGEFTPKGTPESNTALFEYDELSLVTSPGQSGSALL